ncbi:ABC transporter substrate-binding protein [Undibacterium sp. YM2]|uniref:transporter substrate-binding domain-containing protein n=1 Tax=Undibacterium sp. YM2 TaxID=2058625 RepID=UPI001331CA8C|nr:transporter substrate-binding domain-containing protein [Undibacterium sp. YM2]BBB68824.1 ABC transporter substrate-binding protein [Undibacterium sp. YM2]
MTSGKCGKTVAKWLVAFSIFCLHAACPVLAQQESIRIATFGQGGPMEKAAAIHLTECYKKLGMQVEFVNLPGNRALQESNSGRLDGELMRKTGLGVEYPNLLQIMVPLATTNTVAFAMDKNIDLDKGWASLKEHTFSYETGTKVIEQNTQGFSTGHAEHNIKAAFRQMLNRRVELIVIDEQAGLQLVKEMGLEGTVHMLTPPISTTPLYHYLHKKHADLANRLEALLRKNH